MRDILIVVRGGVVQDVYSEKPLEVRILDFDDDSHDPCIETNYPTTRTGSIETLTREIKGGI